MERVGYYAYALVFSNDIAILWESFIESIEWAAKPEQLEIQIVKELNVCHASQALTSRSLLDLDSGIRALLHIGKDRSAPAPPDPGPVLRKLAHHEDLCQNDTKSLQARRALGKLDRVLV